MKKLIALALIALMGAQFTGARVISSRSIGQRAKTPTEWIIRTGISLNGGVGSAIGNIKDEYKEYDDGSKVSFGMPVGYELSVAFNRAMGRSGLYWGMELGLGTRGISSKGGDKNDEEYHKKLLTWNLKYSPFTLGYKYNLTQSVCLDAHLGVYASYDFAGNGSSYWTYDGEKGEKDTAGIGSDDLEGFKRFDAGIQLGIGVWYKRFNFDFSWQRGFVNAYDFDYQSMWDIDYHSKIFSNNLMFRVGYAF